MLTRSTCSQSIMWQTTYKYLEFVKVTLWHKYWLPKITFFFFVLKLFWFYSKNMTGLLIALHPYNLYIFCTYLLVIKLNLNNLKSAMHAIQLLISWPCIPLQKPLVCECSFTFKWLSNILLCKTVRKNLNIHSDNSWNNNQYLLRFYSTLVNQQLYFSCFSMSTLVCLQLFNHK